MVIMRNTVGNEKNPIDAITQTLDLEYNIQQTYLEAIDKISDSDYKYKLKEFLENHEQHINALTNYLIAHKREPLNKSTKLKSAINKMRIMFADLVGDRSILLAVSSNELDINKAYERINARHDIPSDSKEIFKHALKNAKNHKLWFDNEIQQWQGK